MIDQGKRVLALALAALLGALPSTASAQISAGQLSNFQDGTTQGWQINLLGLVPPPPATLPVNVPSGGPAGATDRYLQLTSIGGSGPGPQPGSKLMVLNPAFWGGDWLAAGITSVRLNAINLGNTDLLLRFLVEDAMMAPPTNIAISSTPLSLTAGSGWQSLEFPLFGPGGLAPFLGSVNAALTNTTIVRIYHSPTFVDQPISVVAQMGLDNITAVGRTVPEPSTFLLLGAGGLGLWLVRRRSTR